MRGVQLKSLTASIIAGTTAPIFYNVLQLTEGGNFTTKLNMKQ